MASEKTRDGAAPKDAERRALLKAATVAGGAVAASTLLPGSWKKPVATMGGLPAHAQTSQTFTIQRISQYAWWNSYTAPDRALEGFVGQIYIDFNYHDSLGEMNKSDHSLTFTIVSSGGSTYGPITTLLEQVYDSGSGDGTTGTMACRVLTPYSHGGTISWFLSKGLDHQSNVVSAQVVFD